ncbi:unannotated protein [freshwater metagenome]|uniref:Unannotated protein n=1 Tax=freshwater metagenome TaxID=449393 RepID=A0A6J6NXL7_9ZZZZ
MELGPISVVTVPTVAVDVSTLALLLVHAASATADVLAVRAASRLASEVIVTAAGASSEIWISSLAPVLTNVTLIPA